jgi:hypothetical protein
VTALLQVPLDELDLRRLREAAEEMREQLSLTSKAVSGSTGALRLCSYLCLVLRVRLLQ